MKTLKRLVLSFMLAMFGLTYLSPYSTVYAQGDIYKEVINQATSSRGWNSTLSTAINWWDVVTDATWADLFNEQILKIIGYVIDIFIVIWIALAFIGGYKIMTSSKEDSLKEWIRFILFGVLWIIIMVSARFLAEWLVWSSGIIRNEFANVVEDEEPNWIAFASALYNNILYPFIKIALYFVVGFLFFMMVGRVVSYVTSTDDSVKKKAWWVIIWCIIGILIVMWSKQLVEAVMWKQEKVLNADKATWINGGAGTWMWNGILNFENLPLIVQIINWVMWLTMFIILVLIIIQWYKMFTKPDDPKNRESLKKTLLYIIIWVLVIGAAYAISSVLVINNIPVIDE